jgi:dynein heavy chain
MAMQVILGGGKVPKDLSWPAAKKLMANVDQFLNTLVNFDKDNTPVVACEWIEKNLFVKESFNPTNMKSKSSAAAGMCAWVINIVKYYRIYEVVEPKRVLLAQANVKLEGANTQVGQGPMEWRAMYTCALVCACAYAYACVVYLRRCA